MVTPKLPGLNNRTPGGLPGTEGISPGPARGMPKMGPGPGPTAQGVPDPDKLVELFTSYTSGQMDRSELILELAALSTGEGGILEYLETMDESPGEQAPQSGIQPIGSMPEVSAGAPQSLEPIPQLTEALDKRHQRISLLLQEYGLTPEDADQMSTELNQNPFDITKAAGYRANREYTIDPLEHPGSVKDPGSLDKAFVTARGAIREYIPTADATAAIGTVERTLADQNRGISSGIQLTIGDRSVGTSSPYWDEAAAEAIAAGFNPADVQAALHAQASQYQPRTREEPTGSYNVQEDEEPEPTTTVGGVEYAQYGYTPEGRRITNPELTGKVAELKSKAEALGFRESNYGNNTYRMIEAYLNSPELRAQKNEERVKAEQERVQKIEEAIGAEVYATGYDAGDIYETGAHTEVEGMTGEQIAAMPSLQTPTRRATGDIPETLSETEKAQIIKDAGGAGKQIIPGSQYSEEYKRFLAMEGGLDLGLDVEDWQFSGAEEAHAGVAADLPADYVSESARLAAERGIMPQGAELSDLSSVGMTGIDTVAASGVSSQVPLEPTAKTGVIPEPSGDGDRLWDQIKRKIATFGLNSLGASERLILEEHFPDHEFFESDGGDGDGDGDKDTGPPDLGRFPAEETSHLGLISKEARIIGRYMTGEPEDKLNFIEASVFAAMRDANDAKKGTYKTDDNGMPNDPNEIEAFRSKNLQLYSDTFEALKGDWDARQKVDERAAANQGDPLWEGNIMEYPSLYSFVNGLTDDAITGASGELIANQVLKAMADLERQKMVGTQEVAQQLVDKAMLKIKEEAATLRQQMTIDLQAGAAIGKIGEDATLAAKMEEAARAFEVYKATGQMPAYDAATGKFSTTGQTVSTIEQQGLDLSREEIKQRNDLQMFELFGQTLKYRMDATGKMAPVPEQLTLEGQKFQYTKQLQQAELSGQMMRTDASGNIVPLTDAAGKPIDTMAGRRWAWEQDNVKRAQELDSERIDLEMQIAQGNIDLAASQQRLTAAIEGGKLQEAIAARGDRTLIEQEGELRLQNQLRVNTLLALADPATMLFSIRYGLIPGFEAALGIDFGDDILDPPPMVAPNTFPSAQELANATDTDRRIMLAEIASDRNINVESALADIMRQEPGGRQLARPEILNVTR